MNIPAAPRQAPRCPRSIRAGRHLAVPGGTATAGRSAAGHAVFLGGPVTARRLLVIRQLLLGATVALQGCYNWRSNTIETSQQARSFPTRIRVILADGTPVLLDTAHLSSDSLFGYRRGSGRGTVDSPARFAVREIARIDERHLDERRTFFAVSDSEVHALDNLLLVHESKRRTLQQSFAMA